MPCPCCPPAPPSANSLLLNSTNSFIGTTGAGAGADGGGGREQQKKSEDQAQLPLHPNAEITNSQVKKIDVKSDDEASVNHSGLGPMGPELPGVKLGRSTMNFPPSGSLISDKLFCGTEAPDDSNSCRSQSELLNSSVAELRRKAQEHSAALWQLAQTVQKGQQEMKNEIKEEEKEAECQNSSTDQEEATP